MQVARRADLIFSITLAVVLGVGVGVVSAVATPWGWLPGLVVGAVIAGAGLRRPIRRARAVRAALDARIMEWIESAFPFYHAPWLDAERFLNDVKIVLDEWVFEAVGDASIDSETVAGVAAGAALLLHGRPDWELPSRQTILLYPDRFDNDYLAGDKGEFDGMAHQQGPVILSSIAVRQSWNVPDDGHNVVLHELAHLLDYENEVADGVPSLVDPGSAVAWRRLVRKEIRRVRIGRSMLRRYAAKNSAELFATAVENFFERPELMQSKHPELFDALRSLFNLDPRRA